jgi:hypothetical protein
MLPKKRWTYLEAAEEEVNELQKQLNIHPVLCKLLVLRNIKTFDQAKDFFRPSLDKLHDPFLMRDMDLAVSRIEKALENKEHILIYGDYDVDGTTAVSLVYSFFKEIYEDVTSPEKGFDFQVTVSPSGKVFKAPNGKEYPVNDIKLIARTKSTRLAKTDEEIRKLVSSIPNLLEIFTKQCKPAEELKEMLENYLAIDASSPSASSDTDQSVKSDPAAEAALAKSVEDQFADL